MLSQSVFAVYRWRVFEGSTKYWSSKSVTLTQLGWMFRLLYKRFWIQWGWYIVWLSLAWDEYLFRWQIRVSFSMEGIARL